MLFQGARWQRVLKSSRHYDPLPSNGADTASAYKEIIDDNGELMESGKRKKPRRVGLQVLYLTSMLLALSTCILAVQNWNLRRAHSYSSGFDTDLAPARSSVRLTKYRFTGGLDVDSDGKLYRVIDDPNQPQYVGEPSDAIDDAWEDIMIASEIVLTGEEAQSIAHRTIRDRQSNGWRLEMDVYHSLHCVNEVRKALDFEYYYPGGKAPYFFRVHIDHCLDYLRQVVQCQADLTPLTFFWSDQVNATLPNFGDTHTCRDFKAIHEWSLQRRAAHPGEHGHQE